MSFGRFFDGDVYIFEHVGGFIECCMCSLAEDEADLLRSFPTPRAALEHLDEHAARGDDVESAKEAIVAEYADLDVEILPYRSDS